MHTRTATAALLLAAVAGLTACGSTPTTDKPAATATSEPAETITPATDDAPTEEPTDTGDTSYKLTDTISYTTGVEVSLSGFARKTSSADAAPADTPYLRFVVKVANGSDSTVDLGEMSVTCLYGEDGQQGDQIFDEGLDLPTAHLLPGKSINVTAGCELPKGEHYIQIEVTPTMDSEAAIFAGDVK